MVVEQIVEVPATRRLFVEVPREIPVGRTILTFTPAPAAPRQAETGPGRAAIERCWGIAKDILSSGEFLEMRHNDKELDNAQFQRDFRHDEGAD